MGWRRSIKLPIWALSGYLSISISKELNIKPNIFRVCSIKESLKFRYDPTQAIIVVAPDDHVEKLDITSKAQRYIAVQKLHTLAAFKDLDKDGEFANLTGHHNRKILCYVVNTRSIPLMRYGNIRANDISSKFARKMYPQDLLHVYETLSAKDSSVNSIKVIERMAKLGRVGPNEATSLRKLCKWRNSAFTSLMELIRKYELYETSDVRSSGNAGNISRGEKLCMPNVVFNNLAKVDEAFFEANYQEIIEKRTSLKGLTEKNLKMNEVQKLYGVLSQITGYQTIDALKQKYPGKFDVDKVKKFLGAEIKGESRNLQAKMLENYFEGVTKHGTEMFPLKFESIKTLEEPKVRAAVENFDAVVLVMKEAAKDECVSIMKRIILSNKTFQVGFFLFPREIMCFNVLAFLRAQNTSMMTNFKIIPVFFTHGSSPPTDCVEENLRHGIIFGKFCVLDSPLKVFQGQLKVEDVLKKVLPPESTVAVISEPGLEILQAHSENLSFKSVVYFGSDKDIGKFRNILSKDKLLLTNIESGAEDIHEEGNKDPENSELREDRTTSTGKKSEDFSDESTTSPAKESQDSSDESTTSPAKESQDFSDENTTSPAEECSEFSEESKKSGEASSTSPIKETTSQVRKHLPVSESSTSSPFGFKDEGESSLSCTQDSGFECSPFVPKQKSKVVKKLIDSVGFSDNLDMISSGIE